ncbi:Actin cortical patch SUR7/pH-response regulator PalI [Phaffia rhodozyma]|uniref:Actin cortical patch SUR7/pH-response regulator PalI n=1 Tax=Phaffia rhodozyma TaxID=264483 RepID=A0A0F7SHG3_PHARH|nr:Actin cortical patch SUR7/pH-response regulator PalI [Phaffia rhodozyma]
MPNPATPGTVLTLAATILLALASFCTPLIKSLYLFKATLDNDDFTGTLTLGTLGYCIEQTSSTNCSSAGFGYTLDLDSILAITAIDIPTSLSKWITYVLIVNFFGMTILSSIVAGIGASVAMVAFGFDIVLFFLAKKRINSLSGASSSIGMSTWLVLAGWICLMFSGCAFGFGRRCIQSRGPRDPDGGARGRKVNPDDAYDEQIRQDAFQQEQDRKYRLANGDMAGQGGVGNPNHLPGFQPYETIPLTSTGNRGQGTDQWLEEEDEQDERDLGVGGNAAHLGYRDQAENPYAAGAVGVGAGNAYAGSIAGRSEVASYAMGGFNAGRGAGGRGLDQGAPYGQPGGLTRRESDDFAAGQATPGGYPSVTEAGQDYYQAEPYSDPYAQPYRQPYNSASTSPPPNRFFSPTTTASHYDTYSSPQLQQSQQQPDRQVSPAMHAPAPQRLADPQGNSYANFLDVQHHDQYVTSEASGSGGIERGLDGEGVTGPEPPRYELTATPGFSSDPSSGYRQEKSAFTGYP